MELGSFDDVVSRQPPVSYVNRMVLNEKLVETTLALLLALHCFRQNAFSDRGDCSSFSLAKQLYAAHIQASYRAHIFLSDNHLDVNRKSVWILATFNILDVRGDLKRQSYEKVVNL